MGVGRAAGEVRALLDRLPRGFRLIEEAASWFVVGPTGAFVVACPDDGDTVQAADRARAVAAELRARLDRSLGWSPFVDALVVADQDTPVEGATRVPARLLHDTIAIGPLLLDEPWVEAITACLSSRRAVRAAG